MVQDLISLTQNAGEKDEDADGQYKHFEIQAWVPKDEFIKSQKVAPL